MDDILRKFIRYNGNQFLYLSHMDLANVAYEYKEAYKQCQYNRQNYNASLEMKIDYLTEKIDKLNKQVEENDKYKEEYHKLKHKKLTFKERLRGRIQNDKK